MTTNEKTLAVVSHLAPIAGYFIFIGHVIIPLTILLVKGKDSKYIEYHARESLNFQISMTIYWLVTIALIYLIVGLLIAIPLGIFQFVVMVIASFRAGHEQEYRYPLCIRFIR